MGRPLTCYKGASTAHVASKGRSRNARITRTASTAAIPLSANSTTHSGNLNSFLPADWIRLLRPLRQMLLPSLEIVLRAELDPSANEIQVSVGAGTTGLASQSGWFATATSSAMTAPTNCKQVCLEGPSSPPGHMAR